MPTPASPAPTGNPRTAHAADTGAVAPRPTGVKTLQRIKNRPKAGPLHKSGMIVFAVGLLVICLDVVLFASGVRDMPWWLHLLTALAPLGLAIGLAGTALDGRRARD